MGKKKKNNTLVFLIKRCKNFFFQWDYLEISHLLTYVTVSQASVDLYQHSICI